MNQLVVIAHNIRSTHNVGAIFRTCDGFGVTHIYFSGYTPYPAITPDTRLPHETAKLTKQIHKTALGAEATVPFSYTANIMEIIDQLAAQDFTLLALEQTSDAILLPHYHMPQDQKIALLLGEEVDGISPEILKHADQSIEIPMQGSKESFNVSVACGIALYALRFTAPL